jgi:hypothetical protein
VVCTQQRRSGVLARALVAVALALLSIPVLAPAVEGAARSVDDLPHDQLEVSDSCVAIGQHLTITVWGSGFGQQVPTEGGSLTLRWDFAGVGSDPAIVLPGSRPVTTGTFTMTFDVTGVSQGFGAFDLVGVNANGVPGFVGGVNVEIQPTCPVGTASCSTTPGPAALLVSTAGYDPTFAVQFFYQYHLPDQVGPVAGTAASDGSVHAQFQPAPQSLNATVTALIVQPPGEDSPSHTFFITVAAPVCHDVAPPALSITPSPVDFGPVNVGSASGPVAFNVVNVGKLATPISSIAIGGGQAGDFVIESNACGGVTLVPSASCAVRIHFAPGAVGARAATLTATSSNKATALASLTGTGVAVQPPGLSINPTNKNFGSVPLAGSSAPTVFTVTNTGTAPQTIASIALTGGQAGEFAVDPGTCGSAVMAGGGTCTLQVRFQPTGAGARTATLVVQSNAKASATSTLRGTAEKGALALDPNPADFGVVAIGTTSLPVTVKVTNSGGAALTISAVRVGGTNAAEFLVSSDTCTGQSFAPGASCGVSVLFRPGAAGSRSATLDIDDGDGATSGALHGVGIFEAILKFTPPVVSAGSLATVVGQSFPPDTAITLQWQEPGIAPPFQVTTDATGAFRLSFVIIVGERLGPRHLEPAPNPGVLDEPRPVAPLLVQAPTFRPQGVAVHSGGFSPSLVSRG